MLPFTLFGVLLLWAVDFRSGDESAADSLVSERRFATLAAKNSRIRYKTDPGLIGKPQSVDVDPAGRRFRAMVHMTPKKDLSRWD